VSARAPTLADMEAEAESEEEGESYGRSHILSALKKFFKKADIRNVIADFVGPICDNCGAYHDNIIGYACCGICRQAIDQQDEGDYWICEKCCQTVHFECDSPESDAFCTRGGVGSCYYCTNGLSCYSIMCDDRQYCKNCWYSMETACEKCGCRDESVAVRTVMVCTRRDCYFCSSGRKEDCWKREMQRIEICSDCYEDMEQTDEDDEDESEDGEDDENEDDDESN
jgi:hypothetical protein